MNNVVVGTYNMSWASDYYENKEDMETDKAKISEYSFLLKNKDKPRKFWENAKINLAEFITKFKPVAVGLQEMNLTDSGSNTGSDAIDQMLTSLESPLNQQYKQVCKTVDSTYSKNNEKASTVGISIIFNSSILGEAKDIAIVDNLNQKGFLNGGRPLLMILTEKGYLLVNMHGAQDPTLGTNYEEFNKYMEDFNKSFLESEVSKFLNGTVPTDIFIMGDFNDRYDAIQRISINNEILTCGENTPYSCCHNWDSSSSEGKFQKLENAPEGYGYGKKPDGLDIKSEISDEEVHENLYRYKGDKVFGKNIVNSLQTYDYENSDGNRVSDKSDHKLVFGLFNTSLKGGKRKSKKNRYTKNKKKHSNKTKKHRKSKRKY
jgi:hypothetical protein